MKTVLHKANTRGHANHGWLTSYHSFSFANYHNPQRMNFGVLRVLNDDTVAGGKGFGMHPHSNMEIISIPLEGDLQHMDNMGNSTVIKAGDVQIMSAGTGISHSEYNKNKDTPVKFLQIWLYPNKQDVVPRYDQVSIAPIAVKNKIYQILSPNKNEQGVWAHQNAWFHLGDFDQASYETYTFRKKGNGAYIFVLEGSLSINDQKVATRDGFGVWETDSFTIDALSHTKFLVMEIPMI